MSQKIKELKKKTTSYECANCGHNSPKWNGKCLNCGSWDSYFEKAIIKKKANSFVSALGETSKPVKIGAVVSTDVKRIDTQNSELNRVLGGGLVPGEIVLIGGHPGVGKSTLLLQTALSIQNKVLYVSGEESNQQIKLRADRLGLNSEECFLYNETDIQAILATADKMSPDIIIIDSIQTCSLSEIESLAGSVVQIRSCAQMLQQYAKKTNIAVILVGHINKEGSIAGPMILEHIVDAVLLFEGDRKFQFKILRALKNRFGNTDEIGLFEMKATGLQIIENPSEMFLSNRGRAVTGQAIGTIQEGMRTVMSEIQVLINKAIFGTPQRSPTGFDTKRLHMILAVIENKLGVYLGQKDVYLNIAGGLKINETSLDMAVVVGVISAQENIIIPGNFCFIGELALSGDFTNVSHIEQRISEAERLGFEKIIIPARSKNAEFKTRNNIKLVQNVNELSHLLRHEI